MITNLDIQEILDNISRWVPYGGRILVAVSGGVDSSLLLHLLARSGKWELGCAHFNHKLRGSESDGDAVSIREKCASLNVPFFEDEADVGAYCAAHSVSLELGARELRYGFLCGIMEREGYSALVLGHHSDDQVETVLHNFLRGTGVRGLSGMKEYDRERKLLRPLLGFSKNAIQAAAVEMGLSWREDATNFQTEHDRCWLRNEVIPMISLRRPGFSKSVARAAKHLSQVDDFVKTQAESWLKSQIDVLSARKPGSLFSGDSFLSQHSALRAECLAVLWERNYGSRQGFGYAEVDRTEKWLSHMKDGSLSYFGPTFSFKNKNGLVSLVHTGCRKR